MIQSKTLSLTFLVFEVLLPTSRQMGSKQNRFMKSAFKMTAHNESVNAIYGKAGWWTAHSGSPKKLCNSAGVPDCLECAEFGSSSDPANRL